MATALKDAFKASHEELVHQRGVDVRLSGVAGCIVIHDVKNAYLHIAWAGNVRAVVADLAEENYVEGAQKKGPVKRNLVASPLTSDHTTKNAQEKERVVHTGAELVQTKGDDEIVLPGERFPAIPITRCVGNKVAHCLGVTHEPSVNSRPINGHGKEGRFVVMGSDGLWDCIRNSEVVITVHEHRKGNLQYALQHLESKAQENWVKKAIKQGNTIDDCTIGLLYIHGFEGAHEDEQK